MARKWQRKERRYVLQLRLPGQGWPLQHALVTWRHTLPVEPGKVLEHWASSVITHLPTLLLHWLQMLLGLPTLASQAEPFPGWLFYSPHLSLPILPSLSACLSSELLISLLG